MIKTLIPEHPVPYRKVWKECVGTGRMNLALHQEYQDMLGKAQEDIGFRYIRGHGLFHDDMGIYRVETWEGKTREFYNFTYLDRVFDSYLRKGIKPFLELGFMPSALASGPETVFYWQGRITPPKDPAAWVRLVQATLRHLILRYGRNEVLTWPVEVWNEPNLTQFWKGADQAAYFELYRISALGIKEVDPGFQVGGPAICGGSEGWLAAFLDFVKAHGLPLDFVSHHAYSGRTPSSRSPELLQQELSPPQVMLDELSKIRAITQDSGLGKLPVYITEFNTSYHPLCPVHDTALNAAWLARILSEAGNHVDLMSYWTFGDVFEEHDVPRSLFHGGFGLLAHGLIPKPTHHLFRFFDRLGSTRLNQDQDCILTRREDGSLALAVWQLDPSSPEAPDHQPLVKTQTLRIPRSALPPGFSSWSLMESTVNESWGNPRQAWINLGRPRWPQAWQVEAIRQTASPRCQIRPLELDGDWALIELGLTGNQVSLLEINGIAENEQEYWGQRDELIKTALE